MVIKEVNDSSTELTMIMGGQADWIWQIQPPISSTRSLRWPNLATLRQEAMRIAHLAIDAGRTTTNNNPLTNAKVRQAICECHRPAGLCPPVGAGWGAGA